MMDWELFKEILVSIVEMMGVIGVGWFARRLGYFREEDLARWSRIVTDILFPPLIFHSIVMGFDPARLGEVWPLPLLGIGIMALGAVLGFGLRKGLRSRDADVRKTFHHFCAINNFGFLPLILVDNLWGTSALALLFFMHLGSYTGYWTIGVALLGGSNIKEAARSILSPALVALAVGLVISVLGYGSFVPDLPMTICDSLGSAAIPIIYLLIGASMYGAPIASNKRDLAYLAAVRLLVLPIVTILILQALPLPPDVYNLALIISLMPVALSSTVLARRFGGSPEFAATAGVVTTLLAIVTVPIGCVLLLR